MLRSLRDFSGCSFARRVVLVCSLSIFAGCLADGPTRASLLSLQVENATRDTLGFRLVGMASLLRDQRNAGAIEPLSELSAIVAPGIASRVERKDVAGDDGADSVALLIYRVHGNEAVLRGARIVQSTLARSSIVRIGDQDVALALASLPTESPDDLYSLLDTASVLPSAVRDRVNDLKVGRPWIRDLRIARISARASTLLTRGRRVRFAFDDTRHVSLTGVRHTQNAPSTRSWRGTGDVSTSSQVVLTAMGITGFVRIGQSDYEIIPVGGGLVAVFGIDRSLLPKETESDVVRPTVLPPESTQPRDSEVVDIGVGARVSGRGLAAVNAQVAAAPLALAPGTDVDNGPPYQKVLVVFTQNSGVYDQYGAALQAVNTTNQAYINTGINQTVILAGVAQTTYNESAATTTTQLINHLTSTTDGQMDNVHAERAAARADLVMLVISPTSIPSICGVATTVIASYSTAFAATKANCLTGFTFAHELGHLQGAHHDPAASQPPTGGFAYGRGYVDPNGQWRTIMAYGNSCGECLRVQYFSNPSVLYPPTGQPMGTSSGNNNALALTATRSTVGNFIAPASPGMMNTINYGNGQKPKFSWPTVAFSSGYTVFRCDSGQSFCGSVSFSYTNLGSSWQVEDVLRTLSGLWPPCSKSARYYVRATDLYDGSSEPSWQQPVVCLL
jgi:peptidyl-Asp metalloendopeptidase